MVAREDGEIEETEETLILFIFQFPIAFPSVLPSNARPWSCLEGYFPTSFTEDYPLTRRRC